MATFYNQATLSYNGNTTTSNITTGELLDALTMTKTALRSTYTAGDTITYVISLVNTGCSALSDLTITDDLGAFTFNAQTRYPLTYVDGSLRYLTNGTFQATPTVAAGPPLVVSGISIPANGNATVIYETTVSQYAPVAPASTITNTATVSGASLATDVESSATVTAQSTPSLTISKALSPTTVTENGRLTYTFTIQNSGTVAATAADNVYVTDTFNPILDPITVTFNNTVWSETSSYTYNDQTGLFTTLPGRITVPAATYVQDAETGAWIVTPGTSTLVVTGTV